MIHVVFAFQYSKELLVCFEHAIASFDVAGDMNGGSVPFGDGLSGVAAGIHWRETDEIVVISEIRDGHESLID